MNMRCAWKPVPGRKLARFGPCRRGGAAVEFALVGLALVLFLAAIVELGMLGFSIAAQARAVQAAARHAALDASKSLADGATSPTEDSLATIQGYFDQYADPPMQPAGTAGGPVLSAYWCAAQSVNSTTNALFLSLTASNTWVPFGFNLFNSGFTIKISTVATVMGTQGTDVADCVGASA